MIFLLPEEKDVSDIAIAIKSFGKAWGSVDPLGNYKEGVDPRQLWIMKPLDEKAIGVLVKESVPHLFRKKFTCSDGYNEGTLHAQAFKCKTGLTSTRWVAKVTCIINKME